MKGAEILLKDEDVKRWYDNLREGSQRTGEEYLRWMGDFCDSRLTSPAGYVRDFRKDKKVGEDILEDYIRSLKARKSPVDGKQLKPKTLNNALCAVRNWLSANDLEVTRRINVGNLWSVPTIEGEHPPSPEELGIILDHANQRTRAAMSCIAFSGIRPEAISRLKLGDFPELELGKQIMALKVPMIIRVRAELSKNRRPFFTFMVKRGVDLVIAYLQERVSEGETLTPESPVIAVSRATAIKNGFMAESLLKVKGEHMGRKAVSAMIRRAMRSSGTRVSKFRPYVLRGFYDWALQNANLPHVWEAFLMGHSGPVEEEYSVRKRLTQEQLEKMRTAFAQKVEAQLVGSIHEGMSKEDVEKTFEFKHYWLAIEDSPLKVKSPEEILREAQRFRKEPMSMKEETDILREEARNLTVHAVKTLMDDSDEHVAEPVGKLQAPSASVVESKDIPRAALQSYLDQGWEPVMPNPPDRFLVRRKNRATRELAPEDLFGEGASG